MLRNLAWLGNTFPSSPWLTPPKKTSVSKELPSTSLVVPTCQILCVTKLCHT